VLNKAQGDGQMPGEKRKKQLKKMMKVVDAR
jgi:hypothetical protein